VAKVRAFMDLLVRHAKKAEGIKVDLPALENIKSVSFLEKILKEKPA